MKLQTNRDFVSVVQMPHVFLLTETAKKIKNFHNNREVKLQQLSVARFYGNNLEASQTGVLVEERLFSDLSLTCLDV